MMIIDARDIHAKFGLAAPGSRGSQLGVSPTDTFPLQAWIVSIGRRCQAQQKQAETF